MNCDLKFPQSGSLEDETRESVLKASVYVHLRAAASHYYISRDERKMTQKESCYRTSEYLHNTRRKQALESIMKEEAG